MMPGNHEGADAMVWLFIILFVVVGIVWAAVAGAGKSYRDAEKKDDEFM